MVTRQKATARFKPYRWEITRVGKVKVGLSTKTNLLPETTIPAVTPPEEPVVKVPSGFKDKVSEPAAPALWLRVEEISLVVVTIPLAVSVRTPTSACADWLTTSEVPVKYVPASVNFVIPAVCGSNEPSSAAESVPRTKAELRAFK